MCLYLHMPVYVILALFLCVLHCSCVERLPHLQLSPIRKLVACREVPAHPRRPLRCATGPHAAAHRAPPASSVSLPLPRQGIQAQHKNEQHEGLCSSWGLPGALLSVEPAPGDDPCISAFGHTKGRARCTAESNCLLSGDSKKY